LWTLASHLRAGRHRSDGQAIGLHLLRDHFVGKWSNDLSVERASRTMSGNMLVDECIVRFTHDIVMDAIIPGLARGPARGVTARPAWRPYARGLPLGGSP